MMRLGVCEECTQSLAYVRVLQDGEERHLDPYCAFDAMWKGAEVIEAEPGYEPVSFIAEMSKGDGEAFA